LPRRISTRYGFTFGGYFDSPTPRAFFHPEPSTSASRPLVCSLLPIKIRKYSHRVGSKTPGPSDNTLPGFYKKTGKRVKKKFRCSSGFLYDALYEYGVIEL